MPPPPSNKNILNRILNTFFPWPRTENAEPDEAEAERLRVLFKARYHQFRLLLSANNKALDAMAEIEAALEGVRPFGMSFVREQCTRAMTSVFQMTRHLRALAPDQYPNLELKLASIQMQIEPWLAPRSFEAEGPLSIALEDINKNVVDQVGEKMANLGELRNQLHLRVPEGFAITARAYRCFMEHNGLRQEIDRCIQAAGGERMEQYYLVSGQIHQLIVNATIPEELRNAILQQYQTLERKEGAGVRVAMRSSAQGEDSAQATFAGQYRTKLNVSGENILDAYKEVVASKYSVPAISYRLHRGLRDDDVAMCVGCLRMVDAVSSGVLYSRNPLDIRDDSMIVDSAWGIPTVVVNGLATTDHFTVSRSQPPAIRGKQIRTKDQKTICLPTGGISRVEVPDVEKAKPSIEDEQVLELARTAEKIEEHYQSPQDIEWVVAKDGVITIVQSRLLRQSPVSQEECDRRRNLPDGSAALLRGGVTASSGVACGPVFLVQNHIDILQFPEGAVLVTNQARSRWATLMDRAVAVVSERGSVVGHLATVAREFHVPALFGLEGAMDVLHNGQVVTVDADGLRVNEGSVESLLHNNQRPKGLMKGTPVFEVLEGAAQHILPLNFLAPDSPSFRARNCKTLHDITRFCHEKSIECMFQFGIDNSFPERSSKQLIVKVPMKWWVLNLDDGFAEEVDGKYVNLSNIVSIPMLALWEGITKFPWAGPPAIDGAGFLSVMFRATTNTDLTVGTSSTYAERNYFMISRNFCAFISRLGAHFATAEALISDRPSENYLSFRFKGGAADDERRQKRVHFLADILDEYGFRTEAKRDQLTARVMGVNQEEMKILLKIIGHVSIHTRQIDMIMNNRSRVEAYRVRLKQDIDSIIAPTE